MKSKMTQEHREFLSGLQKKNETQIEHIAGCEQCFNYYLFGDGYHCKEYPAKHRIKDSDFKRLMAPLPTQDFVSDTLKSAAKALGEHFKDPSMTEDDLDEVTIVSDDEWTKGDIMREKARQSGVPLVDIGIAKDPSITEDGFRERTKGDIMREKARQSGVPLVDIGIEEEKQ